MRRAVVSNENDENVVPRVTRAKAAALSGPEEGAVKKALASKKTGNTLTGAAAQRKRPALGDVSNVAKVTGQDDGLKDGKKPAKVALASKTTTTGVQKPGRTAAPRQPLGLQEKPRKASADLKRPASGSGVMGGPPKKRSISSGTTRSTIKEEQPGEDTENEPPLKRISTKIEEHVEVEVEESLKLDDDPELMIEVAQGIAEDLDKDDAGDPLMVHEYAVDIFEYLLEIEPKSMPNYKYMEFQEHLSWTKRDMLNDWLIEVHQKFQLLPETFYLAINLIDRFLSAKIVQLDKLQLVGITCMFLASKYEEVMSPHVSNFSYLAQEYTDDEILAAERFVLETIGFSLSYPNPMNFLRRISKADSYDMQTRTLGKYLLEISSVDHEFMKWPPSLCAAAAMYFARLILDRGVWDVTLVKYSGYTEEEITPVFEALIRYCTTKEPRHEAFHTKYASRKYMKASLLVRQWARRNYRTIMTSTAPADNVLGASDIKRRVE